MNSLFRVLTTCLVFNHQLPFFLNEWWFIDSSMESPHKRTTRLVITPASAPACPLSPAPKKNRPFFSLGLVQFVHLVLQKIISQNHFNPVWQSLKNCFQMLMDRRNCLHTIPLSFFFFSAFRRCTANFLFFFSFRAIIHAIFWRFLSAGRQH